MNSFLEAINMMQRVGLIEHFCEVGVGEGLDILDFNCCNRNKHAIYYDMNN